jgi:LysR family hydrogen peroxide-inducible transcriptional activator
VNLQQLEYIIAVDTHRHFLRASEHCYVTQATLSMMIKKLEEELRVKIFDRSKQPVKPTATGVKIIAQARRILQEATRMKEIVSEEKGEIGGELKLGIIPTLAPYLLPMFITEFITACPLVKLIISEYTTADMIERLKSGQLDAGILATPMHDKAIKEQVLFYEKYFLYVNHSEKGFNKKYVLPADIDIDRLWLLEEGHCMRSQILNLCELKKMHEAAEKIHYEAGSIETLKNLVEKNLGITVIPELATYSFSTAEKKGIRYFKPPTPVREISIVTHRGYIKEKLIGALKASILSVIPEDLKKEKDINILNVEVE